MPELAPPGPATVILLGAGFSSVAGVPLAAELFREEPEVDRITRRQLVRAVRTRWLAWHEKIRGTPEEYLAQLETEGGMPWHEAVWYAGLVIALRMGQLRPIGFRRQLTVTKQNLDRRSVPVHEEFWTAVFTRTIPTAVVTTNYDILAERGIRHQPRPRVARPGFNYGAGDRQLAGGGYPSYSHIQRIVACGRVPLLKLHGSVSWAEQGGKLVQYHDCRPAIRGDAVIVAPVRGKQPPPSLEQTWQGAHLALAQAERVVVVGYSLPEYDDQVIELLRVTPRTCRFHVLDPAPGLAEKYERILGRAAIQYSGLPNAVQELGFLDPA